MSAVTNDRSLRFGGLTEEQCKGFIDPDFKNRSLLGALKYAFEGIIITFRRFYYFIAVNHVWNSTAHVVSILNEETKNKNLSSEKLAAINRIFALLPDNCKKNSPMQMIQLEKGHQTNVPDYTPWALKKESEKEEPKQLEESIDEPKASLDPLVKEDSVQKVDVVKNNEGLGISPPVIQISPLIPTPIVSRFTEAGGDSIKTSFAISSSRDGSKAAAKPNKSPGASTSSKPLETQLSNPLPAPTPPKILEPQAPPVSLGTSEAPGAHIIFTLPPVISSPIPIPLQPQIEKLQEILRKWPTEEVIQKAIKDQDAEIESYQGRVASLMEAKTAHDIYQLRQAEYDLALCYSLQAFNYGRVFCERQQWELLEKALGEIVNPEESLSLDEIAIYRQAKDKLNNSWKNSLTKSEQGRWEELDRELYKKTKAAEVIKNEAENNKNRNARVIKAIENIQVSMESMILQKMEEISIRKESTEPQDAALFSLEKLQKEIEILEENAKKASNILQLYQSFKEPTTEEFATYTEDEQAIIKNCVQKQQDAQVSLDSIKEESQKKKESLRDAEKAFINSIDPDLLNLIPLDADKIKITMDAIGAKECKPVFRGELLILSLMFSAKSKLLNSKKLETYRSVEQEKKYIESLKEKKHVCYSKYACQLQMREVLRIVQLQGWKYEGSSSKKDFMQECISAYDELITATKNLQIVETYEKFVEIQKNQKAKKIELENAEKKVQSFWEGFLSCRKSGDPKKMWKKVDSDQSQLYLSNYVKQFSSCCKTYEDAILSLSLDEATSLKTILESDNEMRQKIQNVAVPDFITEIKTAYSKLLQQQITILEVANKDVIACEELANEWINALPSSQSPAETSDVLNPKYRTARDQITAVKTSISQDLEVLNQQKAQWEQIGMPDQWQDSMRGNSSAFDRANVSWATAITCMQIMLEIRPKKEKAKKVKGDNPDS